MRFIVMLALIAVACASTSQTLGYQKAVTARDKAASVLPKGDEPYERHSGAMLALLDDVDAGYSQAQTYSTNQASEQWLQVMNELQRFAADWRQLDALSEAYLRERVAIILADFDAIVTTEAARKE